MSDTEAKQDWTTKELAEAANLDPSTIRHLLLDGKLRGYKRGRDWFIPYQEGQDWLDSRRKKKALPD